MRRHIFCVCVLSLASVFVLGCHGPSETKSSTTTAASGESLDQLKAEYSKLSDQYKADCLTGSPGHIESTRALCEQERQKMAPLGNALIEAEAKAAERRTNP